MATNSDDDTYLIWSHEHQAWWGPDECGYTERVSMAGRYTRPTAIKICTLAIPGTSTRLAALPEMPVRLSDVKEMIAAYDEGFADRPEPWR